MTDPETPSLHPLAGYPDPSIDQDGPNPADENHEWEITVYQQTPCSTCPNRFSQDPTAEGYLERCRYIHGLAYTVKNDSSTTNLYEYLHPNINLGTYDRQFLISKYQEVCAYLDHLYWILVGKVGEDTTHWVYEFEDGYSVPIIKNKVFVAEFPVEVVAVEDSGSTLYLKYSTHDEDGNLLPTPEIPYPLSGQDVRSISRPDAGGDVGTYCEPIQVGDSIAHNLSGADLKKYIGGLSRIVEPPEFESSRVKIKLNKNTPFEVGDIVSVYGYGKERIPIPRFQPFSAFWTRKKTVKITPDDLESGYYYFRDDDENKVPIAFPLQEMWTTGEDAHKIIEGTFQIIATDAEGATSDVTSTYIYPHLVSGIKRMGNSYDATLDDYVGSIYLGDLEYASYSVTFCHRVDTFAESNYGMPTQCMCQYCRRDPTNSVATMIDNNALDSTRVGYYGIGKDDYGNHWYCEKMNDAGVKGYLPGFKAGKCFQTWCPGFQLNAPTQLTVSHINNLWMGGGILQGTVADGDDRQDQVIMAGFPSLGYMCGHTCILQVGKDYYGGFEELDGLSIYNLGIWPAFTPSRWKGNGMVGILDGTEYKFGFFILKRISSSPDDENAFGDAVGASDYPYIASWGDFGIGALSQSDVPNRIAFSGGNSATLLNADSNERRYGLEKCHAARRLPSVSLKLDGDNPTYSYFYSGDFEPEKGGRTGFGEKAVQKVLNMEQALPVNIHAEEDTEQTFIETAYTVVADGTTVATGFNPGVPGTPETLEYKLKVQFRAHGGDEADYSSDENYFNETTEAYDYDATDYHQLPQVYRKFVRGTFNDYFEDDDLIIRKVTYHPSGLLFIYFYPSPTYVRTHVTDYSTGVEDPEKKFETTFLANGNAVDASPWYRVKNPFTSAGRAREGDCNDKIQAGDVLYVGFDDNIADSAVAQKYKDAIADRDGFYLTVCAAIHSAENDVFSGTHKGVSSATIPVFDYVENEAGYLTSTTIEGTYPGVPPDYNVASSVERLYMDVVVVDATDFDGNLFYEFLYNGGDIDLDGDGVGEDDEIARGTNRGDGMVISGVYMGGVFPPSFYLGERSVYTILPEHMHASGYTPTFRLIPNRDRDSIVELDSDDLVYSKATGEVFISADTVTNEFDPAVNCIAARGYFYSRQKNIPAELVNELAVAMRKPNALRVGGFGEPYSFSLDKMIAWYGADGASALEIKDGGSFTLTYNPPTEAGPDGGLFYRWYDSQDSRDWIEKEDLVFTPYVDDDYFPPYQHDTYYENQPFVVAGWSNHMPKVLMRPSPEGASTSCFVALDSAVPSSKFGGNFGLYISAYDVTNTIGQLRMAATEITNAYIDVWVHGDATCETTTGHDYVTYANGDYTYDNNIDNVSTDLSGFSIVFFVAEPIILEGLTCYTLSNSSMNVGAGALLVDLQPGDTIQVNVTDALKVLYNMDLASGNKVFACLLGNGIGYDAVLGSGFDFLFKSLIPTYRVGYKWFGVDPDPGNPPELPLTPSFQIEKEWTQKSYNLPEVTFSNLVVEFDPDSLTVPSVMPTSFDFDPLDTFPDA